MHTATKNVLAQVSKTGISELQIAKKAKVSPGSLRAWRDRGVSPSVDNLAKLAKVVGMQIVVVPDGRGHWSPASA